MRPSAQRLAGLVLATAALIVASPPHGAGAQRPTDPATATPATGIVFVGSSIFHRWTDLAAEMAPLPIVNLAFDGAMTFEMLRLVDVVVRRRPKVIAYYCGSNDIDAGESPDAIVDRIQQFVGAVTRGSPSTRVIFVAVNRAPEKQDRWDVVDAVNRRVEGMVAGATNLQFVDVNAALFAPDGTARLDLFMPDRLHLRPAAYEAFARILKPVLAAAYQAP